VTTNIGFFWDDLWLGTYKLSTCIEDGGSSFLRNIGTYTPSYTASHPRINQSSVCSDNHCSLDLPISIFTPHHLSSFLCYKRLWCSALLMLKLAMEHNPRLSQSIAHSRNPFLSSTLFYYFLLAAFPEVSLPIFCLLVLFPLLREKHIQPTAIPWPQYRNKIGGRV
jgi:hypothetical protein